MRDTADTGRSPLAGRKIWIIGINYAPDQVGIAPYTAQLADYLQERGSQVEVTTGIPYYPSYEVQPSDRWTISRREELNGVKVRRLRHTVPRRMNGRRRVLHEATFFAHVLARRAPFVPDVIVGVTPALAGAMSSARKAKQLGVPLVMVIQDLVGPGVTQSGIAGGRRYASVAARLEAQALQRADQVSVLHEGFRAYALGCGVPVDRLNVIRNWSYAVPACTPPDQVRRQLGWPNDRPIVLYAGNMGLKMGLRNVIEAARLAEARSEKILFVLLGDGNQRRGLMEEAAGISTLKFADSRYGSDFADALGAADVLLINERPTVSNMSLPSKLAYYFTSGRPVLAAVAEGGTTALELERAEAGVVVESGKPEVLLAAALELASDPVRCSEMGEAGRRYGGEQYDRGAILARYEQMIVDAIEHPAVHEPGRRVRRGKSAG